MRVGLHFDAHEFAQPARHGFPYTPYPHKWHGTRLKSLVEILDKIRSIVGAPVHVLSGYRSPKYNKAIRGARFSKHVKGQAADIKVNGIDARTLHDLILALHNCGVIKVGGLGSYSSFVHVDVRRTNRLARWRE
jgi:uncharacterized protein YcbK (DUF882 family)